MRLITRFARRLSSINRRPGRPYTTRRLQLDRLEDRCLLTGFAEFAQVFDLTGTGTADRGHDVHVEPTTGNITVVGSPELSVLRLSDDGNWKGDFAGQGFAQFPAGGAAVQVDSSGRIIAAGGPNVNGTNNFSVARILPDGNLDSSFSGDGIVTHDFGTQGTARAVEIDSAGKYIVAGPSKSTAGDAEFALMRIAQDGTIEQTVRTTLRSGNDQPFDLQLLPDGDILLVGRSHRLDGTGNDLALVRYNSDFSLDTAFGNGGIVITSPPGGHGILRSAALDSGGQIVAVGRFNNEATVGRDNRETLIARYGQDGSLDTSFGGNGIVTHDLSWGEDQAYDIQIDAAGRYVVAGRTDGDVVDQDIDAFVARLDVDGSLDTSFGPGGTGVETFHFGRGDTFYRVTIDAAGRIVLAGATGVANSADDTIVVRLNPGGPLPIPVTLFADGFEAATWNDRWVEDAQNDWFRSTQRATEGRYSAEVDGSASDAALTMAHGVDLTPYGSATLSFSWLVEQSIDRGEYLKVDLWNGSSWSEVASLRGNVDQENVWHQESIDVPASSLVNDFKVRFRGKASRSNEDANVDDVQLIATSLAASTNQAPVLTSTPVTSANQDLLYRYDVEANDPDSGDLITFSLPAAPSGMTVDASTGVVDWTPSGGQLGAHEVTVRAEDSSGLFDQQQFTITVSAAAATKFYVVDASLDGTFEYAASGTLTDSYNLGAGNNSPKGVAADATGNTIWVIDNDDHVYVYDTSGTLLRSWKALGLSRPEGIASDGTDIWIVDRGNDRVHFFAGGATRTTNSAASSDFPLAAGNPRGITTDGNYLWVVDTGTDDVYKYTVGGSLLGSWALDSRNTVPRGITIDPAHVDDIWVADSTDDAVYQYSGAALRTSGSQSAAVVFDLASGNTNPQGIADPPLARSGLHGDERVSTVEPVDAAAAVNVWIPDRVGDELASVKSAALASRSKDRASLEPAFSMEQRQPPSLPQIKPALDSNAVNRILLDLVEHDELRSELLAESFSALPGAR